MTYYEEHLEERRKYQNAYYLRNLEARRKYQKEYRAKAKLERIKSVQSFKNSREIMEPTKRK